MMTKLEIAARQALEALEVYEIKLNSRLCNEAITALREALAEQEYEIDWIETNKVLAKEIIQLKKQAEQEPVGHLCEASFGRGQVFWFNKPADNTPLYAAPVRTKDLTDVDLWNLWEKSDSNIDFARAVIAADSEKNK